MKKKKIIYALIGLIVVVIGVDAFLVLKNSQKTENNEVKKIKYYCNTKEMEQEKNNILFHYTEEYIFSVINEKVTDGYKSLITQFSTIEDYDKFMTEVQLANDYSVYEDKSNLRIIFERKITFNYNNYHFDENYLNALTEKGYICNLASDDL